MTEFTEIAPPSPPEAMYLKSDSSEVLDILERANADFSNWITDIRQWLATIGEDLQPAVMRMHNVSMDLLGVFGDFADDRNWEPVQNRQGQVFYRPTGKTRVSKTLERQMQALSWPIPDMPGMPKSWAKADLTGDGATRVYRYGLEYFGDAVFVTWGCTGVDYDSAYWTESTADEINSYRERGEVARDV